MGSRLEKKSASVRKKIENHEFTGDETREEYEPSKFGGFSDYFRRKKIKLQNLDAEVRSQNSDKPQIFRGVVCHVNGYTQPSLNDLHTMVVQHGGGFIQYLDGKTMVTHIIASNLTPKKKEEFRRYRIVKPAWIVDSIKAGRLLPWDAYRAVDEGVGQKVLGFDNGQVVSQASKKQAGYREQTDASWYTSQFRSQQPTSPQLPPRKPPKLTQTVTPDIEDIEDDEYDLPSSVENALYEAGELPAGRSEIQQPQIVAAPQTPPQSSPPPAPVKDQTIEAIETSDGAATATDPDLPLPDQVQDDVTPETIQSAQKPSALRDREGSQEPDVSHAVVAQSDVWKTVSPSRLAQMTAEEHNALILSDPKIRKSTVVHPDFLEQYYRESRLHHLSTWKADLKSQLQALAAEKTSTQKARQKKLPGQRRYVMHVDFDSFFAAVSLKKYPQYKDKPAVVAHGGGSGSEIASCNYPARKFGVSNGMWMRRAQELCPELKVLPYDFPGYEEASRQFYDAIMATGGIVQSVSIDEALVDISAICIAESGSNGVQRNEGAVYREQKKADEVAQKMRDEVLAKTGCNVSVGIGGNILQAKCALRKAKPAGQYQLRPEEVLDFMGALEVTKLPGVAYSIGGKLEEIGIKLVKDIRDTSKERLVNTLGPKTGEKLWEYARGIDKTEVGDQVIRKSVSAEVNWGVRFESQEQVDEFMHGLSGELSKRLLKERVKGKQLTMKVMKRAADAPLDPPKHLGHGKCDVFNKSMQLGIATNDHVVLTKETIAMMKSFCISPGELRGIGIQMQKLEPIKAGPGGGDESSQRRLQFNAGPSKPKAVVERTMSTEDPIQDDPTTPQRPAIAEVNRPSAAFRPVEQPGTPSKKPLNTLGTQFVLPTQVDPSVLAELPEDIRAKLARQAKPSAALRSVEEESKPEETILPAKVAEHRESNHSSRAQSPAVALPPQSQIDPSILEALPEDVRNEVLGFYKQPQAVPRRVEQPVLPQSPRTRRILPPPPPPKRGRGRPRGGGISRKLRNLQHSDNTLTQSNFVSRPAGAAGGADEELDPEVLAALPEELRLEVLAQQRQARLQRTGGIDMSMHRRKKMKQKDNTPFRRVFTLPPKPEKPMFTSRKLSTLPELRSAVSAWIKEFNDEGPYDDDVNALIKYLKAVVVDEKDMDKAVSVVKWLGWVIDDAEELPQDVLDAWREALGKTQLGVQDAATQRGLGKLAF
ncbi:DNA repair protein rev1 [Pseudocercospora fuligena]|uniref:DNA repair protein REV1 n=1 Tax=Pseudocercospora fuligena TaxID=685502 RepID=A0A8H6RMC8_9PEZI|nr:DNA repair protein rev1 [Pseudocercospora fuligena]